MPAKLQSFFSRDKKKKKPSRPVSETKKNLFYPQPDEGFRHETIDLARKLKVKRRQAIKCLVKTLGEEIEQGEIIAVKKTFSKKRLYYSPVSGVLDSLTEKGILTIKVPAKEEDQKDCEEIPGWKIEGEWGWGDKEKSKLYCLDQDEEVIKLDQSLKGKIIAIEGALCRGAWHKAKAIGAKAIVCQKLPDKRFEREVSKEYLLLNGAKKLISLPLLVVPGESEPGESSWKKIKEHHQKEALINPSRKELILI